MRILMVCLGNICRSPTAEAVLRAKLQAAGLGELVTVESAGTGGWHVGSPPDRRAIAHGARRGYDLAPLRARQLEDADFERFDLLLAMDEDNLDQLVAACPLPHRNKVRLLMDHAPGQGRVVPDPYTEGPVAFERVLDLVEIACDGLVAYLRTQPLAGRGNFPRQT
jgi:protein-tyrosine phosphatase